MAGKWDQPLVPKRGWVCLWVEDHDEPSDFCEMCEVQQIRYVHVMEHPGSREIIRAGCICAGKMEGDVDQARRRESEFVRRQRWLDRVRRVSRAGCEFINVDGFHVVIWQRGYPPALWGGTVTHRATGWSRASRLHYATSDAAKLASFDVVQAAKNRLF